MISKQQLLAIGMMGAHGAGSVEEIEVRDPDDYWRPLSTSAPTGQDYYRQRPKETPEARACRLEQDRLWALECAARAEAKAAEKARKKHKRKLSKASKRRNRG